MNTINAVSVATAEAKALELIVSKIDAAQTSALADEIQKAKRIFVGGAGRSLLSMKGFAMRLMQTEHETYLVGEVCTPSVQPGDLLIVASGRGTTQVTLEVVRKARKNGARTAVITMNPDGTIPKECECVVVLPPKPEAGEVPGEAYAFARENLVGNFPELAITMILDGVIAELMVRDGQGLETIQRMHANLE